MELVSEGGSAGPSIDGFSSQTASAGEEVVVHGQGLDADDLGVEVAGVPVAVLAAEGETLRIRMPDVDRPGLIAVAGRTGAGLSADTLTPRVAVRVFPEELRVAEGTLTALTALVTGTRRRRRMARRSGRRRGWLDLSRRGLHAAARLGERLDHDLGGEHGRPVRIRTRQGPCRAASARARTAAARPTRRDRPLRRRPQCAHVPPRRDPRADDDRLSRRPSSTPKKSGP